MTGGRGFALRYRAPDRSVTAVWLADESVAEGQGKLPDGGTVTRASITVRVPVRSREVTIVSMLGERSVVPASGGSIAITAGPVPVYVVDPLR
jgi:hypothetical protein